MKDIEKLREKVREEKERRGDRWADLVRDIPMSASTLKNILYGDKDAGTKSLTVLCAYAGVNPEDYLSNDDFQLYHEMVRKRMNNMR